MNQKKILFLFAMLAILFTGLTTSIYLMLIEKERKIHRLAEVKKIPDHTILTMEIKDPIFLGTNKGVVTAVTPVKSGIRAVSVKLSDKDYGTPPLIAITGEKIAIGDQVIISRMNTYDYAVSNKMHESIFIVNKLAK